VIGSPKLPADCSDHIICVTSLNMRKWMRDRLQRRNKKTGEQEKQPAPPPLQPAYFEADKASDAEPESSQSEMEDRNAVEPEPEALYLFLLHWAAQTMPLLL